MQLVGQLRDIESRAAALSAKRNPVLKNVANYRPGNAWLAFWIQVCRFCHFID